MMVLTLRSPNVNTRSTISCSTGDTSPSSLPSSIMDLISSSVTLDSLSLIPKALAHNAVLLASNHTTGDAVQETKRISPANALATFSGLDIAMRFGISSPRSMERNMTMNTMIALERTEAVPAPIPRDVSREAKSRARLSPENIPVRMPTRVTPICTVERNLSGSEEILTAALAALSPLDASALSLDFLEEIIAISAIEKTPLIKMSRSIIKASISAI